MHGPEQRETTDELRRRLYRADTTAADLERYLAERAAVAPDEPPSTPSLRRRRWPAIASVGGVLAILALAVGALVQQPGVAPAPAASATHAVAVDVGTGRVLTDDPGRFSGPRRTTVVIDGTSTAAQLFEGVGDAVVPVALPDAEFGDQRAQVRLYSARPGVIVWSARRDDPRDAGSSSGEIVAEGRITTDANSATPTTFRYAGAQPSQIAVEAPADLQWTLIVADATDARGHLH